MPEIGVLLAQVRDVRAAEQEAESTASVSPDMDAMSVLELGDGADSNEFIRRMAQLGVRNVTPAARRSYTRFPTPLTQRTTFYRGPAPDWWLDRFVLQSPHWIYFSGHFTGELYNATFDFNLDFSRPTAENNVLWKRYLERDTFGYVLGERCRCVLIIGCSAINYPEAVANIQTMFTGPPGAPIILGFRASCPTERTFPTSRLCRQFVDALNRDWVQRHDHTHIADSWLEAARNWSRTFGRRVAYLDAHGNRFRVTRTGDFAWEAM